MYEQELKAGLEAVQAAGEIQLRNRMAIKGIEIKDDNSPVTAVDKECEERIIGIVDKQFASDGILAEEGGTRSGTSGRRWIIDPLDGTRPYIHGIPTFSVLLALQEGDDIVAGMINLPAMGMFLWATKGGGAFLNGAAIHVSTQSNLSQAFCSCYGFVDKFEERSGQNLLRLMRSVNYCYGFMDAYSYASVAEGRMDFSIGLGDKPWDAAAPACIIREAGGVVTDLDGTPSIFNGAVIATNGYLHDAVLNYFR